MDKFAMARSSATIFALSALAFGLVSTTGCQEHRRLEAETAAANEKVRELRPQVQKLSDELAHYSKLRNETISERNKIGYEAFTPSGSKSLEDEVAELQAAKARLEKDVKAVEDEHQEYKKANS
jgi:outer membrane murein-binding lipoprotein Lpp